MTHPTRPKLVSEDESERRTETRVTDGRESGKRDENDRKKQCEIEVRVGRVCRAQNYEHGASFRVRIIFNRLFALRPRGGQTRSLPC